MPLRAYHIPQTLEETLRILDDEVRAGRDAAVIAGGTDVLVRMRSAPE